MSPPQPPTEFSIADFRNGDLQQFRYVYDTYYTRFYHYALKILKDDQEAREAANHSFIQLFARHKHFDSLEAILSFLNVTTYNKCMDILRHRERRRKLFMNWRRLFRQDQTTDPRITDSKLMNALHQEIEALPPRQKEVFKLSFLQEMTTGEVAEFLNITPRDVLTNKSLARQNLQSAILRKGLLE